MRLNEIDRKLTVVLEELETMKVDIAKLQSAVEDMESGGNNSSMTQLVGEEIKQKLDQIIERLP